MGCVTHDPTRWPHELSWTDVASHRRWYKNSIEFGGLFDRSEVDQHHAGGGCGLGQICKKSPRRV
jgi:hypothetical protein